MSLSKLKRESLRILLKFSYVASWLLPAGVSGAIKKSWNRMQLEEGRAVTRELVFKKEHGAARMLDIRATSGFGEAVHPDALYFPQGFGAHGWKYIMSLTPFPCGIVYFENPEILVSDDGENWAVPDSLPSPFVAAPSDWIGYNSDPSLLFDDGRLYLIYREVRSVSIRHDRVRLFAVSTRDGEEWSAPETLFDKTLPKEEGSILLSPTFLKKDGRYFMWHVERISGEFVMKLSSGGSFAELVNSSQNVHISGMEADDSPWHVDVVEDDDALIMALCVRSKSNDRRHSVIFAKSGDGLTWNVIAPRIDPDESLGEKSLYRAALVKANGAWKLYYSCQDEANHWIPLVRDISF